MKEKFYEYCLDDYQAKIIAALDDNAMLLNEFSKAMCYKGITKKMSATVEQMLKSAMIKTVVVGSVVKYYAID